MALDWSAEHLTERRWPRGRGQLVQCSTPAQASDHAVAKLSDLIPRTSRAMTHRLSRHLAGGAFPIPAPPAFPILHSILRAVTSLFVTGSDHSVELADAITEVS